MILIADCGGTSTVWALTEGKSDMICHTTDGYNAAHGGDDALAQTIRRSGLIDKAGRVTEIWFYGAGCTGDMAVRRVAKQLSGCFPGAILNIASDMTGAARALCGREPGIACILGTGSNSCMYDGEKITANTPPLGFILGDEGSGAAIGKRFLGLLLKGHLPEEVSEAFASEYPGLDRCSVIEKVYRGDRPSAFLGSICVFLGRHTDIPTIHRLVTDEFRRFFRMNLAPYPGSQTLPVHFTGSVASHFSRQLSEAADAEDYLLGRIVSSPIEDLVRYHSER